MKEVKDFKWVKLTNTMGLSAAEVIAGRLHTEGIPAWVWQQGAGGAMGLTIGPLGFGHVMVPEHLEDEARNIIDGEFEIPESEFDSDLNIEVDDEDPGKIGVLAKSVLLILAIIIDLPAVIIAFFITLFARPENDHAVTCPYCSCDLDLSQEEMDRQRYTCPDCGHEVDMNGKA